MLQRLHARASTRVAASDTQLHRCCTTQSLKRSGTPTTAHSSSDLGRPNPAVPSTQPTRRRILQLGTAVAAAAWLAPPAMRPAHAEAAILVGPPESGGKFATINAAIAAAEAGSTITVLPGRYEERLLIEGKFLTIQSSQVREMRQRRVAVAVEVAVEPASVWLFSTAAAGRLEHARDTC